MKHYEEQIMRAEDKKRLIQRGFREYAPQVFRAVINQMPYDIFVGLKDDKQDFFCVSINGETMMDCLSLEEAMDAMFDKEFLRQAMEYLEEEEADKPMYTPEDVQNLLEADYMVVLLNLYPNE